MKRLTTGLIGGGLALLAAAPLALAQLPANTPDANHPGKAVYDRACAMCHANPAPGTRAASFATLTGTAPAQLKLVLTEGVMKPMAAALSPAEIDAVVGYLTSGQKQPVGDWTASMMCAPDKRVVNVSAPVAFGGFGVDPRSTRSLSARQAGLTKAQAGKLQVAWAVGFPQTQGLGTGAVVLGDTAFVSGGGKLLALDAATGCARWAKDTASRNTPQVADVGGRKVLALATQRGQVQLLDARDGSTVWSVDGRPANGVGNIRGGVVIHDGKVIVPISASGVGAGQNAKFECCVGHGAVVALSAADGRRLWEYHTMEEAKYNGFTSSDGVKQRGPSGAPIWSLPTIDAKRGRVIVTTGENTSHPATDTSDAIIAIDLNTGKEVWKFQAMKADVWNMSCDRGLDVGKSGPNCPWHYDKHEGRDYDFGATAMVVGGAGGRDLVLAGQKSGDVWALDAATGKLVWTQKIGEGTTLGGVHWGTAADDRYAYVPIADSNFSDADQAKNKAGMYALRLTDGKLGWSHMAQRDCEGERGKAVSRCIAKFGFSAAPVLVDGALVTGTLDGKVVVLDAATGRPLRTLDTIGPVKTVNGVAARGGSIDAHAVTVGAGTVFVTSGYGAFNQTPGNALIALKPGA